MLAMIHHSLKKHKYKIALGVPFVFLLASSLSLVRNPEEMCIIPEDNRYVKIGETVTLFVTVQADSPINVLGGTIRYPNELVRIDSISEEDSIIDLWTEKATTTEDGTIRFSGGVVSKSGFLGDGKVLSITLHPLQEGEAVITFDEKHMLAHDGTGMEVDCSINPITLSIRSDATPNPDVNGDTKVNIFDFGIVSARIFMTYDRSYDLNMDGIVSLEDIKVLFKNISNESELASLTISLFQ